MEKNLWTYGQNDVVVSFQGAKRTKNGQTRIKEWDTGIPTNIAVKTWDKQNADTSHQHPKFLWIQMDNGF